MASSDVQTRRNFLKVGAGAVGLAALAVAPSVAHASARVPQSGGGLPTGAWDLRTNDFHGSLNIASYDEAGNIVAGLSIAGGNASDVVGFFDEVGQKVVFNFSPAVNDPRKSQVYTGYLIREGEKVTLVGSFETFATGAAAHYIYGWYAVFQG